jgi:hypothetical protein
MVKTQKANVYQPFGSGYFELSFDGGAFNGRDSAGRHWRFEKLPALLNNGFFALIRITDTLGTNKIEFRYDVYDRFSRDPVLPPFLPNRVSMRELLLAEIAYSPDAAGVCPKYRIHLGYKPWVDLTIPAPYPGLIRVDFAEGRCRRIHHGCHQRPLCPDSHRLPYTSPGPDGDRMARASWTYRRRCEGDGPPVGKRRVARAIPANGGSLSGYAVREVR